jgi:hypothetical protein
MLAGGGFMPAGGIYLQPGWQGGGMQQMVSPLPVGFLPGSASPLPGQGNGPPMGAPPGSPSPGGAASITAHMGVPTSAVGCIIGKGGCNVAQIRALSGARVKVHDAATPGAPERLIEMYGTLEQVAQAQVLIQGFMMTSGASGGPGVPSGGSGGRRPPKQQAQAAAAQMGGLMLAPVMMAPGGAAMYGWSGQPVMYMAASGAGGAPMYQMQAPMAMPGGMMMQAPPGGMMQVPPGMVLVPAPAQQQQQQWIGAPPEGMPYM